MDDWIADTRSSYDTVAGGYADFTRGVVEREPYLRAGLRIFADLVEDGPVVDVGCGPGHVTALLHGLGLDVSGIDLSPGMIETASREHPALPFSVGSMTGLPFADDAIGGLLAFWSLIHIPDDALPGVLGEFRRVLRPGAPVLAGFHAGEGTTLKTSGYGGPMKVNVFRRRPEAVAARLREAGFVVDAQLTLDVDSERPGAMIFAHRAVAAPEI